MKLILCTLLLVAPLTLRAQVVQPFVLDRYMTPHVGAEDIATVHEMLFQYEQAHFPTFRSGDSSFFGKLRDRVARFLQVILIDNFQDMGLQLIEHEVIGHGSRLREFGANPLYELHLPVPYGTGRGVTYGIGDLAATNDESAAISIAGSEAAHMLSQELRLRAMERGRMNYREGYAYLLGKLDLTNYILSSDESSDRSDVTNYYQIVKQRNPELSFTALCIGAVVNILDPTFMASFGAFAQYVRHGDLFSALPALTIGSVRYVPSVSFNLTPFGYEYHLENSLRDSGRVWVITLGGGSADDGFSASALGALYGAHFGNWYLDPTIAAWYQPVMVTQKDPPLAHDRMLGGMASLRLSVAVPDSKSSRLLVEAGYKTRGYAVGEQLSSGPILRAGISFVDP